MHHSRQHLIIKNPSNRTFIKIHLLSNNHVCSLIYVNSPLNLTYYLSLLHTSKCQSPVIFKNSKIAAPVVEFTFAIPLTPHHFYCSNASSLSLYLHCHTSTQPYSHTYKYKTSHGKPSVPKSRMLLRGWDHKLFI